MLAAIAYMVFRLDMGMDVGIRYSTDKIREGQTVETEYEGYRCFYVKEVRPTACHPDKHCPTYAARVFVAPVSCSPPDFSMHGGYLVVD